MNINLKAVAALARIVGMPIEAMDAYFVLISLSNGQEFVASEEDLTKHFLYMLKTGLIQEMYRATIRDFNDDDWKSQVEDHIAELEMDLSDNHQITGESHRK